MAEERRIVTVLFADVVGSTELGETLDPEDVRTLLTRYYEIAKSVVNDHGGTLEKFIGDAVMAIFGLPQAHGDDANRALSAAIEVRDRVRADSRLASRLSIRLGVNTGEVVASREDAGSDFLVTGDAVNIAARLQQNSEPWQILCGDRTARAAAGKFSFGPSLMLAVKGKGQPVRAVPLVGPLTAVAAPALPFIGRERDLEQVELVARRAFDERRPYLISIIAPAGIGKSRLLEEFLHRLPGLAPSANVAIAQCLPYGQRLTYWPLRSVLLRLCGVSEDADAAHAKQAIGDWLTRFSGSSQPRTADVLATTIGIGEADAVNRAELLEAWRATFELAARDFPLVLAFEDLHWSSDSLLDLFEFVMQQRSDIPLLMIALTRPELLDRRPGWGGGRRNYLAMSLEPLSDGSIAKLVRQCLESESPEIVDQVVRRAEGNPFFAAELVRTLMERAENVDDLSKADPALRTLPDTVHATVLARLDVLAPTERRALQVGSVFGRSFRAAGLTALDPGLGDTDRLVDQLTAKDLIRASSYGGVVFRHILIREVAYQTLARSERIRLHAAAAAWLEGTASGKEDALAELIAYHYREAAALSRTVEPGEAGTSEIRRKATYWLARAAGVAAAAAATAEAVRHLRSAIELADQGELADLYERLGDVAAGDRGADAYRRALDLCRVSGIPVDRELHLVAALLARYTRWSGMTDEPKPEITQVRQKGRELLRGAQDERAIAEFLTADAFFSRAENPTPEQISAAEVSARRALAIAEGLRDLNLQSAALDALSANAIARGAWEDMRHFARKRIPSVGKLTVLEGLDAYKMVAWASAILGDLEDANQMTRAGMALLYPSFVQDPALHLLAWRTYTLTLLGQWDEVVQTGQRMLQLWTEGGRYSAAHSIFGFVAAMEVAQGRHDEELAERLRDAVDQIVDRYPDDSRIRIWRPYVFADFDTAESMFLRDWLDPKAVVGLNGQIPVLLERFSSVCADTERAMKPEVISDILETAIGHHCLVLEAQARRAIGVAARDPEENNRAQTIFERIGARPYAARARCERALLIRDAGEMEVGLATLTAVGDRRQRDRYDLSWAAGR